MKEVIAFVDEVGEILFGTLLGSAIEATQDLSAKVVMVGAKLYVVYCDNSSESICGYIMQ